MRRYRLPCAFLLAALSSIAAGCSDDDGLRTGGRSRSGDRGSGIGGRSAREILIGTWKAEMSVNEAQVTAMIRKAAAAKNADLTDDQMKQAIAKVKSEVSRFTFSVTFNADGTSTATKPAGPQSKAEVDHGKWEIVSEDGAKVTLRVTDTQGRDKGKPQDFKVIIEDERTLRVEEAPNINLAELPGAFRFRKQ